MLLLKRREAQPSPEDALRRARIEYTRLEAELCGRHPRLRIKGYADAVAWLKDGGLAVVEAKAGRWKGRHHLLQAVAYALIAEHLTGEKVRLLVLAYRDEVMTARFTPRLALWVERVARAVRRLPDTWPPPRARRSRKCWACFYRKICL